MNQMNEAHRRKLRAQEFENWGEVRGSMKKVQTLVERAYKTDPRVAAYKREQERLQEEKEVKKIVHRFMEALGEVVSTELFKQLCEKEELAALQALAKKSEAEGYECVKAVLLKMKEEVSVGERREV